MHKIKKIGQVLSIAMLVTLGGCSTQPDEVQKTEASNQERTALTLYKEAKQTLDEGLYGRAIELFNHLDSLFPFGPMSKQIQLDLIYAYYKSMKSAQALASIESFIRLNPNDKELDYVYYMRGLINMGSDSNMFQELFNIDKADKNLATTREAFSNFKTLIEAFPDSKYVADARKRMLYLLDLMARRELTVAQYYMKQGAYLAAANRGRYVLENYPNSPQVEAALEVMIESYDQLGLVDMKNDSIQVMKLNYPNNNKY